MVRTLQETHALLRDGDVLGHIRQKNAARNAQAKAEGWTFWTLLSESLAEEYSTVYELELSLAKSAYSDAHKEVYGFRPGWDELRDLNLEEAEELLADL